MAGFCLGLPVLQGASRAGCVLLPQAQQRELCQISSHSTGLC